MRGSPPFSQYTTAEQILHDLVPRTAQMMNLLVSSDLIIRKSLHTKHMATWFLPIPA